MSQLLNLCGIGHNYMDCVHDHVASDYHLLEHPSGICREDFECSKMVECQALMAGTRDQIKAGML